MQAWNDEGVIFLQLVTFCLKAHRVPREEACRSECRHAAMQEGATIVSYLSCTAIEISASITMTTACCCTHSR
jgi:hypothetical protein